MRKIEAVIFDWAGTTVDYGCFAPVNAFIEAFKRYGIKPSIGEVRAPMGMAKKDHVRTMLQTERISTEWKRIYDRNFTEDDVDKLYMESEHLILTLLADYCEPKPYVLETVKKLREKGIRIGSTTGYTDEMMNIVLPGAAKAGYVPDLWVSPDSTEGFGRPYPFMIFENMKRLKIKSVENVIKVGDTVADIMEGVNAGVTTVGVLEGSSLMGFSKEEYEKLGAEERQAAKDRTRKQYMAGGAAYVINNMSELNVLIDAIETSSTRGCPTTKIDLMGDREG